MLEPATYLRLLGELQADFLAAVETADADAPVPSCGDWSVGDLVDHLAGIHHWAAAMARGERAQRLGVPVDLAAHYDGAATELRTTLAELGPDATGRILNGLTEDGRGPVSFWYRRQVHETLIHIHDLRSALGQPELGVPAEVWADTVDEVVTVMYPRQVALGRTNRVVARVELEASDVAPDAGSWSLGAANAVERSCLDQHKSTMSAVRVVGPQLLATQSAHEHDLVGCATLPGVVLERRFVSRGMRPTYLRTKPETAGCRSARAQRPKVPLRGGRPAQVTKSRLPCRRPECPRSGRSFLSGQSRPQRQPTGSFPEEGDPWRGQTSRPRSQRSPRSSVLRPVPS